MIDFEQDIQESLRVLAAGGLILYPTDTIWGIGCDATNEAAVKKVYELKQREESKSLIVLVAGKGDIIKYVAGPDPEVFDFLDTVSRPTTVIYDGAIGLANNLVNVDGTIAIRVVQELFCRHLIKRFRTPIVSTSANISGAPAPQNFASISADIKNGVDYIVRYRQSETEMTTASTIIKWSNGNKLVIRP
ncbi:MAG TPA: L-threonylcarbamoyladenylate synthase [Flavitalea sp.]|nr:L-threonylcarbamoyladenylate synthase [Flavitalea sp.]